MLITWLLLRGARESSRANNIMVVIKLLVLALFIARRRHAHQRRPTTRRSRRTDSPASTRARRSCSSPTSASTRSRPRPRRPATRSATCRSAFSAGWRSARSSTSSSAPCSPAWCRTASWRSADPLAHALELAGFQTVGLDRGARRRGVDVGGAAGLPVRPAAHLLRDGARRPAAAVGRDACTRARASRTRPRWSPASSWRVRVAGRRRGGDLRPDEHRDAVRVRAGLRRRAGAARQGAGRGRGRSGCRSCGSWRRSASRPACSSWWACRTRRGSGSAIWLAIGLALYFVYGYRHSRLHVP